MAANIEFHPSVAHDIRELKINPVEFSYIRDKIASACEDFDEHTSRIRSMPIQFGKLKFGDKRIILWKGKGTLYVLKIFHRRQGYSKESLERIIRLVREYT